MTGNQSNTAPIRRFLNEAFDDIVLEAFCQDYFPAVSNRFTRGMRKDEKVALLLDYCRRTSNGFTRLFQALDDHFQDDEERQTEISALRAQIKHSANSILSGQEKVEVPSTETPPTTSSKPDQRVSGDILTTPRAIRDQPDEKGGDKSKSGTDKLIGPIGLFISIIAIVAVFLVPEVRKFVGLDPSDPTLTPTAVIPIVSSTNETIPTPSLADTSTPFIALEHPTSTISPSVVHSVTATTAPTLSPATVTATEVLLPEQKTLERACITSLRGYSLRVYQAARRDSPSDNYVIAGEPILIRDKFPNQRNPSEVWYEIERPGKPIPLGFILSEYVTSNCSN